MPQVTYTLARLRKHGGSKVNSYYILVPHDLIKAGLVDPNKPVTVIIKQRRQGENEIE